MCLNAAKKYEKYRGENLARKRHFGVFVYVHALLPNWDLDIS